MQQTIYVVRGFLGGRRQPEERFASEARARYRAAYLGKIYDAVMVGCRRVDSEQGNGKRRIAQVPDLQA